MAEPTTPATSELDGIVIESSSEFNGGMTSDQLGTLMREVSADLEADQTDRNEETPAAGKDRPAPPADEGTPPPAKADAKADAPKERAHPLKERHDELRAQIHSATRDKHRVLGDVQAAQERLNQLRAESAVEERRLADLRAGKPAAATPAAASTAEPAPADDPMPVWDGDGGYDDQGKTWGEFQKDHAAWIQRDVERRAKAIVEAALKTRDQATTEDRARSEEEAAFLATDERHKRNVEQLIKDKPDFLELAKSDDFTQMPRTPMMTALIKLHDQGPDLLYHLAANPHVGYAFADLQLSRPMLDVLKESDALVDLVGWMADNRQEVERIASLSPSAQQKALFKVEFDLQQSGANKGSPGAAPRSTPKPPLPAKVGGSRTVAASRPIEELTTDDVEDYVRRMNAEHGLRDE